MDPLVLVNANGLWIIGRAASDMQLVNGPIKLHDTWEVIQSTQIGVGSDGRFMVQASPPIVVGLLGKKGASTLEVTPQLRPHLSDEERRMWESLVEVAEKQALEARSGLVT